MCTNESKRQTIWNVTEIQFLGRRRLNLMAATKNVNATGCSRRGSHKMALKRQFKILAFTSESEIVAIWQFSLTYFVRKLIMESSVQGAEKLLIQNTFILLQSH